MSKIQLRQVYRDQLYNYRPTWILRWGITIFFVFLLLVISVSGFIRYPDIVPATVEITTINPPANLISKVNGKIEIIFTEEGESITKGQVLANIRVTSTMERHENFRSLHYSPRKHNWKR